MSCRLCKTTKLLTDLSPSLQIKIYSCLDIKINPEDGLIICKQCKKTVKKFYKFKQNCLKVNFESRTVQKLELELNNQDSATNHITVLKSENNYEDISEPENEDNNVDIKDNDNNSSKEKNQLPLDISCERLDKDITDQSSVQCELCGNMFNTRLEYRKHISTHKEIKIFECKYCPKRYKRAESRMVHMRSHFGIRPYVCEICGQSSTKQQDLARHKKIHSDEKKHECYMCGRRFKRSSDLCSHIRTHSGLRPYKCTLCDKDYTSQSGLRKHRQTHCKKEPGIKT